ncbi:MAG: hypothetical protein FWC66_05150 [Oscillospiraceae bacterium]|nr:hypothetical protein [Oscillospiraceae bacterium]
MNWQMPAINRTYEDVVYANENRGNLTENIGARSHWTLNRIANNLRYVQNRLNLLGVFTAPLQSKETWVMTDMPRESDINAFRLDLESLRATGFTSPTTPSVPDLPWTHYLKLNNVERILLDITISIAGLESATRWSGTFSSGQKRGLL